MELSSSDAGPFIRMPPGGARESCLAVRERQRYGDELKTVTRRATIKGRLKPGRWRCGLNLAPQAKRVAAVYA